MILHIKFEDNLVNTNLAQQTKIPCHIQVSNVFNIRFDASIPVANGTVTEWDKVKFASRALARAGGEFMYSEPALISLQSMGNNSYQVIELLLFYNDFGWCPIIEHGDYVTPYPYWDSDKEDPDFKA